MDEGNRERRKEFQDESPVRSPRAAKENLTTRLKEEGLGGGANQTKGSSRENGVRRSEVLKLGNREDS